MTSRRALLASALVLAACGSSKDTPKGPVTLTVMTTDDDFKPEFIALTEKSLGVKIDKVKFDITRLTAMLASGDAPDFVRGLGALDTPYIAARGLALDLDPYLAKSSLLKADDLDPVNDVWRYDGHKQGSGPRYGMAKDYSQDGMFWYNTALFDAAKVAYPSDTKPLSYAEWLDLAKRVTRRDGSKIKVYGLDPAPLGLFVTFMGMTASAGGRVFAEDLSTVDFSSPEAQAALQWYIDFAQAKVGPSIVDPNPDGWDWPPFQAGRMAMAGDGYWFGGAISEDTKIAEVARLAPAPQFGTTRLSPCYAATGFWIPKASKHKDDAWRLFEWYFGGEPARQRASSGWGIPSLKSLRGNMPQDKTFQKQAYAVQQAELASFSVLSFSPYARVEALDAIINQQLPNAIKGSVTAGALADKLNQEMNKLLKAGKELVK